MGRDVVLLIEELVCFVDGVLTGQVGTSDAGATSLLKARVWCQWPGQGDHDADFELWWLLSRRRRSALGIAVLS